MSAADTVHDTRPGIVDAATARRVEHWLYREARLLDDERYDDWLALLADDIHYWVPGIEVRHRADRHGRYGPRGMAFFDDGLDSLRRRAARLGSPTAWAEDPPTRHLHIVTNVEVERGDVAGELVVRSVVTSVRGQGRVETDTLHGRRDDILRNTGGGYLLARRRVVITQSVLNAKNLNTFL